MKIRTFCIISWLWFFITLDFCNGQFLSNPSFEYFYIGNGIVPTGWEPCNDESTPDVQPIPTEVSLGASHGSTFLGLAARGENMPGTKNEGIQARLLNPLEPDKCYKMSIDLARTILSDDVYGYYDSQVKCLIWGGLEACDKNELLFETEYFNHQEWENYGFTIHPKNICNYLILETMVGSDSQGYLVMDNIELVDLNNNPPVVKMDTIIGRTDQIALETSESSNYLWQPSFGLSCDNCRSPILEDIDRDSEFLCVLTDIYGCSYTEIFRVGVNVFIPNVFTPNNDGVNDNFRISGLKTGSLLRIFDRNGILVYQNNNYENQWGGADLNGNNLIEDAYWYVLNIPEKLQEYKGYVYIKR